MVLREISSVSNTIESGYSTNEEVQANKDNSRLSASEGASDTSPTTEKAADASSTPQERLSGWRLHGLTLALSLTLLLSTLEISIVSTALVDISNEFQSFEESSWIITSYLLTYTGFIIIWARLSDYVGRKKCLIATLLVFIISSGACGGARTINQLIVFRAFQGLGGSGCLSLVFVVIPEMVEPQQYPKYAAITALVYAVSYLLGPLAGGAICDGTTWRWIFYLNLPAGFAALVVLYFSTPSAFPHIQKDGTAPKVNFRLVLTKIDFVGALGLFAATAFLVTALQQAGTEFAWSSAAIIVLLTLSGVLWIAFVGWQYFLDVKEKYQDPVFTTRLMRHRVYICGVIVTMFAGMPYTVAMIQIPQRFQTINETSALIAGVRLLPFTLGATVGTLSANVLAAKFHIPHIAILLLGGIVQTVASALMSTLGVDATPHIYGYELLLSYGIGMNIGLLVQTTPVVIRGKDQSLAMGALNQFRSLGGVIGLAIAANVLNNHLRSSLVEVLSGSQLDALLHSAEALKSFPQDVRGEVVVAFADGYKQQMHVMIAFSAAQIVVALMMWEKEIRRS